MSKPAWPPDYLRLRVKKRRFSRKVWRIVEATDEVEQFVKSRNQNALTKITRGPGGYFHRFLFGPFRPGTYPEDTRFRRAGVTLGVWYGSESPKTAAIETAFRRSLDQAKLEVPFVSGVEEYYAFSVEVDVNDTLDLTKGVMLRASCFWNHPTDYGHCQQLAEDLRGIGCELIRYASVRDTNGGINIAILSCCAFAIREPTEPQKWNIEFEDSEVRVICKDDETGFKFSRDSSSGEVDWGNPKAI